MEWTNEKYSTDFLYRGGFYEIGGSVIPADYRVNHSVSSAYYSLTFRTVLYMF